MNTKSAGSVPDDLARVYFKRRQQDLASLAQLLIERDFDTIASLGHRLYGSGGAYGLPRISMLGRRLQAAANSGDVAELSELLASLRRCVNDEIPRQWNVGPVQSK